MAVFTPNKPISTDTPTIEVEGLQPGKHRFQLVVEDSAGLRSTPAIVVVAVGKEAGPKIAGISPTNGQQDIRVEAVITGESLQDAREVIFGGEGIKAEILPGGTAERIPVDLMIDRGAPVGSRKFKVVTLAGTAESPSDVVFTVLSLKVVTERGVDEVYGIGPTYSKRLEEKGITNLAQLASMDPVYLAEILQVSESRAESFIKEAARLLGG